MQDIAISYFLLCQFTEAVLLTFVGLVFLFFVDKLSITIQHLLNTSYSHEYMCQDSNNNFLCTYDNCYIHINMFYCSIFVLN